MKPQFDSPEYLAIVSSASSAFTLYLDLSIIAAGHFAVRIADVDAPSFMPPPYKVGTLAFKPGLPLALSFLLRSYSCYRYTPITWMRIESNWGRVKRRRLEATFCKKYDVGIEEP